MNPRTRQFATIGLACFLGCQGRAQSDGTASEKVTDVVVLKCEQLTESSGLLFSMRDPNCVWTHNDSGSGPNLYCFDRRDGSQTGSCTLTDVSVRDWEDMTGALLGADGKTPHLIVADSGDNSHRRRKIPIHLFPEPDPHANTTLASDEVATAWIRYPGGPQDCEALWFDRQQNRLVMVGKSKLPLANVHAVSLSRIMSDDDQEVIVADRLMILPLSVATSAECDASTGDVWITSYWQAWRFPFGDGDPLQSMPIAYDLPAWPQIEAVAVDTEGGVWITTEGKEPKLGRLNVDLAKGTDETQHERND